MVAREFNKGRFDVGGIWHVMKSGKVGGVEKVGSGGCRGDTKGDH